MYWKLILGSVLIVAIYLYIQNHYHRITTYKLYLPKLDSKMKGKKVVFLSDTHFKENTSLILLDRMLVDVEAAKPDIILFGGDIAHNKDQKKVLEQTKDFFYQLSKVAPTYVILGDQDLVSDYLSETKQVLSLSGAKLLNNEAEWISFDDPSVGFWLMGLSEHVANIDQEDQPLSKIHIPENSENEAKILIAHHPQYFKQYLADEQTRPNLILSGHTLGGQVVLPMFGGLYVPGQELNPTYDFGLFTNAKYPDSRMIITRGIGNSTIPIRINNRPEIVLIEFE